MSLENLLIDLTEAGLTRIEFGVNLDNEIHLGRTYVRVDLTFDLNGSVWGRRAYWVQGNSVEAAGVLRDVVEFAKAASLKYGS